MKIERGDTRLHAGWLTRLARALDVDPADLIAENAPDLHAKPATKPVAPQENLAEAFPLRQADQVAPGPRDLPVYAATQAGEDGVLIIPEPIEYVRRPADLMDVRNAFAIYVRGTSMEPDLRPGDLIYINPARPAVAGNLVVIEFEDGEGPKAIVKRLVRRNATHLFVDQLNPPKLLEIDLKAVRSVLKITGMHRQL